MLDVRSPSEFAKGHFPGAQSLPLMTDDERALIGTTYKQQGQEAAMDRGLEVLGPKAIELVKKARELAPDKKLGMYCWRGGMRSGSVAWLLSLYGFKIYLLNGGYKAYRTELASILETDLPIIVVGGYTGTGKTDVLHALKEKGEQTLDLEALACHRGSVFGGIGMPDQPESEQFNNLMLGQLNNFDATKCIWVEEESLSIGRVYLDQRFYKLLSEARRVFLEIPRLSRVNYLQEVYTDVTSEHVEEALEKISKRMGGQNVKEAREALEKGNKEHVISLLLRYYDKAYLHHLEHKKRSPELVIGSEKVDPQAIAQKLISWKEKMKK